MVVGLPANLPDYVDVDISELDLGQSKKVKEVEVAGDYRIVTNPSVSIVSIIIPRALKAAGISSAEDAEGGEEEEG